MKKETRKKQLRAELDEVHAMIRELTSAKLVIMDKEYPLNEWLTMSDYAKKYDMKLATVAKWIEREVIPVGSILVVPELNYLKLIKDQPYAARKYEVRPA